MRALPQQLLGAEAVRGHLQAQLFDLVARGVEQPLGEDLGPRLGVFLPTVEQRLRIVPIGRVAHHDDVRLRSEHLQHELVVDLRDRQHDA